MDVTLLENQFTDYIINLLGPNEEQDKLREMKYTIIKKLIISAISVETSITAHVFCFGSYPLKSYLPESDVDITLVLEDKFKGNLFVTYSFDFLNKIMVLIQNSLESYNNEVSNQVITDITLIFADVKLIKCKFDGLPIDITINNFVGLSKLNFMNYLENQGLANSFFKRSLILIKAWCYYEGCILGSNIGLLASYALEVLIIYLFNSNIHFKSEVDAFYCFFKMVNDIDWDKFVITMFGIIPNEKYYESLKSENTSSNTNSLNFLYQNEKLKTTSKNNTFLSSTKFDEFKKEFEVFQETEKTQIGNKKAIVMKFINIVDPMFDNNNLGKSVNFHNFSKIKKVFEFITNDINKIMLTRLQVQPYNYLNSLLKLFSKSVTFHNSDLFLLSLPQPKILIVPSDLKNFINSQNEMETIQENSNTGNTNTNTNTNSNNNSKEVKDIYSNFGFLANPATVNDELINLFNKKFSLINTLKDSSININVNISKTAKNFVWPSSIEVKEKCEINQLLEDFNKMNFIKTYANKEIIEYILKNVDNSQKSNMDFFKNYNDITTIKNILKKAI